MIGEIRQIGLVYKDISEPVENFKKVFGLEKVDILDAKIKKNMFKEKLENPIKLRFALAMIGNTQVEFIQPLEGKTVYDSFLEKGGRGIHHLGVYTDKFEEAIKEWESKGIKQIWNGIVVGLRFAYFDTTDLLGYILELIEVKSKKT